MLRIPDYYKNKDRKPIVLKDWLCKVWKLKWIIEGLESPNGLQRELNLFFLSEVQLGIVLVGSWIWDVVIRFIILVGFYWMVGCDWQLGWDTICVTHWLTELGIAVNVWVAFATKKTLTILAPICFFFLVISVIGFLESCKMWKGRKSNNCLKFLYSKLVG